MWLKFSFARGKGIEGGGWISPMGNSLEYPLGLIIKLHLHSSHLIPMLSLTHRFSYHQDLLTPTLGAVFSPAGGNHAV